MSTGTDTSTRWEHRGDGILRASWDTADPTSARLVLTLITGTKILDTGDRVLVQGYPDDIAVTEMVACVARRGWETVVVEGDPEFRRTMSRELLARGVQVEDCPLPAEEIEALRQDPMSAGHGQSPMSLG